MDNIYLKNYRPDVESLPPTEKVISKGECFIFGPEGEVHSQNVTDSYSQEFRKYIMEEVMKLKKGSDVLMWWKSNSRKYPNLSRMARDYLAIPGTSASSERIFSSGKELISDRRNSLSPDTIQACQCLKSWL